MKKAFSHALAVVLAALLLCGAVPLMAGAADEIDITDKFTDPAFRAAVQEIIGKDEILDTDVAGIEALDVNSKSIRSLAGLEYFVGLTHLYCHGNQLTSLPALPSGLNSLDCSSNPLRSLPALPSSLRTLICGHSRLSALPALPAALINLECSHSSLTALPELPSGLERLLCHYNELTSLPALSPALEFLWCASNRLTSLPALPSGLTALWCEYNQLTSLDLTGLQLRSLDCTHNNMKDESAVIGFTGTWSTTEWTGGKSTDGDEFYFAPQNFWLDWPDWAQRILLFFVRPDISFLSTWPPFLQWILEYILFGWLWMRWF